MSTSLTTYKDKEAWLNDALVLDCLKYIRLSLMQYSLTIEWVKEYNQVLFEIIEANPIGWLTLDFDKFLNTEEKRLYFIAKINEAINLIEMKQKNNEETEPQLLINCLITLRSILEI